MTKDYRSMQAWEIEREVILLYAPNEDFASLDTDDRLWKFAVTTRPRQFVKHVDMAWQLVGILYDKYNILFSFKSQWVKLSAQELAMEICIQFLETVEAINAQKEGKQ